MEENSINREEYIQKVLDAYRQTPGTTGMVRRPDRLLAEQLYGRGVPLCAVENAFVDSMSCDSDTTTLNRQGGRVLLLHPALVPYTQPGG